MTKKQEIAHVRALIKTLGPDTYLGPWLQEVVDQVEQYIISDIFPDISLKKCEEEIKKSLEACKKDCELMRLRTDNHCVELEKAGREEASRIVGQAAINKERIKQVLQQAIDRL